MAVSLSIDREHTRCDRSSLNCIRIPFPASRQVRQAAMECLVGIAQEYYEQLEPYIKDIFALTCKGVCSLFLS